MDVGPDKTSVCLVRVHLNLTVEFNSSVSLKIVVANRQV